MENSRLGTAATLCLLMALGCGEAASSPDARFRRDAALLLQTGADISVDVRDVVDPAGVRVVDPAGLVAVMGMDPDTGSVALVAGERPGVTQLELRSGGALLDTVDIEVAELDRYALARADFPLGSLHEPVALLADHGYALRVAGLTADGRRIWPRSWPVYWTPQGVGTSPTSHGYVLWEAVPGEHEIHISDGDLLQDVSLRAVGSDEVVALTTRAQPEDGGWLIYVEGATADGTPVLGLLPTLVVDGESIEREWAWVPSDDPMSLEASWNGLTASWP